MSVIIFAETWEAKFKKSTFEAVSYGARVADAMGVKAIAVTIGALNDDASVLGQYGASNIISVAGVDGFNHAAYASIVGQIASAQGASTVIISGTNNGKMIAPAISVALNASLITNVMALPTSTSPLTVRRSCFSSKGLADFSSGTETAVISIIPNSVGVVEISAEGQTENSDVTADADKRAIAVNSVDRVTGKIPLPEAELVVSAGRGMKAPENWNLIEDLATALGASTACSKPVSDIGWRPHSEHVGQTGIQINPNLYIAIGISGAIQHLAGVSASKTIVVINIDPEAPFFKAADYGIIGDAFEVVPQLTEAIKGFKAS